jgi:hypothetical protein
VAKNRLGLHGPFWDWISGLDLNILGYAVVARGRSCPWNRKLRRAADGAVRGQTSAFGPSGRV